MVRNNFTLKLVLRWSLSDCNWTRTHNLIVNKRTLNHLAESSCSHLNFRLRPCFEQGVSWHSGNYRVWIHSEMRAWHDKNLQISMKIWALLLLVCQNVDISSFFGKLKGKCIYSVAYVTFVCLANTHLSWKHFFKVFTSVGSICSLLNR